MFVELIYNAALLVTLSVLYGLLSQFRRGNNTKYKILVGLLFGLIVVAGMNMPVHYTQGIIFDGRSVILVLAGLFGGAIPSAISVVLSSAFRIYLGGAGVYAGVATILVSCTVGLAFRFFYKKEPYRMNLAMLWVVGLVAHIFMLASQLLIPWPLAFEVIKNIWIPILIVFPVATLIIGILFRTEEKRIVGLEKIKQSERLFQTLSENSPVGIFRTNAEGQTIYVNSRWSQLAGISEREALGDGWQNAIHPEDRDRVLKNWKVALGSNSGSISEYRLLKDNGKVLWVYGEAKPEISEEGKIIGYIGTITDITDRKESEKALIQSEENFRRSLDESPMGVRVVSYDDETLYANKAMLRIVGLENISELSNLRFSSLYAPDSRLLHRLRKDKRRFGYSGQEEYDIEIINLKGEEKFLQVFRKEIFWNGTKNFQLMYRDITERKKTERALSESEKMLKEAEVIALMGSWSYDLASNKVNWSENCYRIFGFEPYQVEPDMNFFVQKVHPDDRYLFDFEKHYDEKILDPIDLEFRIQTENENYIWIHDRVVFHYENEKLIKLRGVIRDITDLKEALSALQESEKNYRNLFDNHAAIKLMIDPGSGAIYKANQSASRFYGWSVDQLETMNIADINTLSKENIKHELQKSKSGQGMYFEYEHRLKDGSIRNVEVYSSRVKFQGKEVLYVIIHDITEKKISENELKLLSKSVEQSPISIIITDQHGSIKYVNPKFSEVTGYSFDEVLGKNPHILKSGRHPKEFYEELWKTILSGKDWNGEFNNRKKNGDLYWQRAVISPILDGNGIITNFIGLTEDVTLQKQIMGELVVAKEKAEESERLKSAFLANMSHEIRTPLNAILGFTQMLTYEDDLSPEQKVEFTSIINSSAEGLLQIISDILDISQLETGMLKIMKRDVDVQKMLNDIFAQCKLKLQDIQKTQIELLLDLPEEKILLNTDIVRLIQILMNLLNNSMKFTEKGFIRFGVFNYDESKVGFFVSDTGIGMAQSIQLHIFERFRQADESTTRLYGGTGLGLAIVKNLVELMGGSITLESELKKGTTFRFFLPR